MSRWVGWGSGVIARFKGVVLDTITGAASTLGITGLSAAQGGTVSITGGASSTSANAGGVVTLRGGTPGATGEGGEAQLIGGAGGVTSGAGGNARIDGGPGTNNAGGGNANITGGAGHGTGNGGIGRLLGGASGTGATGNGGGILINGGNAASTNGNGGSVTLTPGTATGTGEPGAVIVRGTLGRKQDAPAAKTVTAGITAAELVAGLITSTGASAPSNHQLPTGAQLDALLQFAVNDSFDFRLINTGTGASDDAVLTTNTGLTLVGNMTVGAVVDATVNDGVGVFRARRTGANAYTVYRVG